MVRSSKVWLGLLVVALVCGLTLPVFGANTVKGTLKSVSANEFVFTDDQGKDWTYRMAEGMSFFCAEGKDAKITDLKPNAMISVIGEKRGDQWMATSVLHHEGIYKDAALAQGTIKKVDSADKKIVITDEASKDWTYQLSDAPRFRLKNQDARLDSFKNGEKVTVVYTKTGGKYNLLCLCDGVAAR